MAQHTILLVDDEKEIIDLLEIYLKNEGFRLLRAANGLEALSILQKEEVDLVVLDIMMPKMDGIEACLKIREQKKHAYHHALRQESGYGQNSRPQHRGRRLCIEAL